jgi:uncharacterized protein
VPESHARVSTTRPTPYLRQLCRHFAHRVEASFDDAGGHIALPEGRCTLTALGEDALVLHATAADAEKLAKVEQVIGDHLERFGAGDGLSVAWRAGAPSPAAAPPRRPPARGH